MSNKLRPQLDEEAALTVRQRFSQWLDKPLGKSLQAIEISQIDEELGDLFGYHALQLGTLGEADLMSASRISHRVLMELSPQDRMTGGKLICDSAQLPFNENSIDVIVLPHVLEFENDPHDVLREIDRILIAEGHLVLLGFNPISSWGIVRMLLAWRDQPPWSGHFFRSTRVTDWLKLLGFEIIKTRKFYFRPPILSGGLLEKLKFMEKLGAYLTPWFGGAYLIVAKKRVMPLTPVKAQWLTRRSLIAAGITEPSTRAMKNE